MAQDDAPPKHRFASHLPARASFKNGGFNRMRRIERMLEQRRLLLGSARSSLSRRTHKVQLQLLLQSLLLLQLQWVLQFQLQLP